MENFNCRLENRNITSEEFILKSKIFDFLENKNQINTDMFAKKIDNNNCEIISKILNLTSWLIRRLLINVRKNIISI